MNGAEAIVQTLIHQGVETVFGYPGGTIMPVYDALLDSPVEHLLCRHEQGAGFSAIGYARSSHRTGVCIATSGPGATNLITALADAMMDSVPIVAITGQVPTNAMGTDAFQEIDILGLSMACTKHSFLVTEPDMLCQTLHQAFTLANSGRPGPVLVDIPKDIQQAPASWHPPLDLVENGYHPDKTDHENLHQALELMRSASRPIAYIGGGVNMAHATEALRYFLQTTGLPSVCTLKGLGTVSPDNDGYLGMLGMHGNRAANTAVQQCDLLMVVGARFDDRVTGQLDTFAPDAKVIHIDIDPAEVHKRRAANVVFHQPMQWVLTELSIALPVKEWLGHCQRLKTEHQWQYDKPGTDIYAPHLLNQLSRQLPDNAIISCDVGQHQMWVAQHMAFHHTRNHLTSAGLGTMGFGLPAAIGAAMARPKDTVILVSGDGSFMMNVQELNTIRRRQLPIKIVLLDNQKLGMVRQWQELFYQGRYSETDLCDNPDFITLANAFGIGGRTITTRDEVNSALDEMLKVNGPWLLHVRIDAMENVWPLVPPGAANHEMLEQRS
ncbi:acetolactate synthase 2 catalytic subunit [Endozoicomonas sp. SCSIO W0465]|uniref:acetolactate synthase 2 catalytic subunit n=1 Tax=Endozoicomonas sp. SCSIO W0465 TaxID=2918516 RepID=UPI002074F848|nr:acetolactate synthase 2 catalytic subunit [Endozoicomonas sp. SCSIO W0465]USE37991.1 acetolactate synthase 2 catalytic subunit [Endozoicomonas sp. SCSIO W0465]